MTPIGGSGAGMGGLHGEDLLGQGLGLVVALHVLQCVGLDHASGHGIRFVGMDAADDLEGNRRNCAVGATDSTSAARSAGMKIDMKTTAFLLAVGLCAPVPAQRRTWIVDVQNRPGTDFSSLQTAFVTVPPGDAVIIRDGEYPVPVTLERGLVVEAAAGVRFSLAFIDGLVVRNVPAGQRVVLRGFRLPLLFALNRSGTRIDVRGCAGHVLIEDLVSESGVGVTDSPWVSIAASTLACPLTVERSNLSLVGSSLRGWDAISSIGLRVPSSSAAYCTDSVLSVSRCTLVGGNIATGVPGSPAVTMQNSALGITGRGGEPVRAGGGAQYAIDGVGGRIVADPVVAIGSVNPAIARESRTIPSLSGGALILGATTRSELRGTAGAAFATLLGRPLLPVYVSFLNGALLLDPIGAVTIASGVLDANGLASGNLPVPNDPVLRGEVLGMQGVQVDSVPRLSSADLRVVR